jgi:hypothetical protein
MLRQAQHERILLNHFKTHSVRPEPVEGLRLVFQQPVKPETETRDARSNLCVLRASAVQSPSLGSYESLKTLIFFLPGQTSV